MDRSPDLYGSPVMLILILRSWARMESSFFRVMLIGVNSGKKEYMYCTYVPVSQNRA